MANYNITDALCNWILDADGEPTSEDYNGIVHALKTLYTTLGGEIPEGFTPPEDVAFWIGAVAEVAGGGGGGMKVATIDITNNTASAITLTIPQVRGDYILVHPITVNVSSTIQTDVPVGSMIPCDTAVPTGGVTYKSVYGLSGILVSGNGTATFTGK